MVAAAGHQLGVRMAGGAGLGQAGVIDGRFQVVYRADAVRALLLGRAVRLVVAGDAHGHLQVAALEPLPVAAGPVFFKLVGPRRRLVVPHVVDVGMAFSAELGHVGGRLYDPEVVGGLVGLDLEHRGIAAVAILAAHAPLPVNVGGQILGRDQEPGLVFFGQVGVALDAGVFVVGDGLGWGRLCFRRLGRLGFGFGGFGLRRLGLGRPGCGRVDCRGLCLARFLHGRRRRQRRGWRQRPRREGPASLVFILSGRRGLVLGGRRGNRQRHQEREQQERQQVSHSQSPQAVITIKNSTASAARKLSTGRRPPRAAPKSKKGTSRTTTPAGRRTVRPHLALDAEDMGRQVLQGLEHEQEVPFGPDVGGGGPEGVGLLSQFPGKQRRQRRQDPQGQVPAHHVAQQEMRNKGDAGHLVFPAARSATRRGTLIPCFCTRNRCTPNSAIVVKGRMTTCRA